MPLDIKSLKSPKGIARYYDDALALSDYHGEAIGLWGGKGAELLGLKGQVTKEAFVDLLENRNPTTKERLTARSRKDRRPAYEVTISVPKSLSLYMEFSGDKFFERLPLETFKEIMAEIEMGVQTRVRKDGADYDRTTGNMIFAWFLHKEARPVEGVSDCMWHIHAIVPNCTFDSVENCWKAVQMVSLKTDAPFYQAAFNSELAAKLRAHGYAIRPTKDSFELATVSRELIEKFSRRQAKIKELEVALEDEIEQKAVTWSKGNGVNYEKTVGKLKSELSKKTREPKSTALLKDEELRANWRERMTPAERESVTIDRVKGPSVGFLESEVSKEISLETLKEVSSSPHRDRELHVAAALLRRGLGRITIAAAKLWAQAMHFGRDSTPKTATKIGIPILASVVKPVTQTPFAKFLISRLPKMPGPRFWPGMGGGTREAAGRER